MRRVRGFRPIARKYWYVFLGLVVLAVALSVTWW